MSDRVQRHVVLVTGGTGLIGGETILALAKAGASPDDLDLIINATFTADQVLRTALMVQAASAITLLVVAALGGGADLTGGSISRV